MLEYLIVALCLVALGWLAWGRRRGRTWQDVMTMGSPRNLGPAIGRVCLFHHVLRTTHAGRSKRMRRRRAGWDVKASRKED